jgi:hypothetical protein
MGPWLEWRRLESWRLESRLESGRMESGLARRPLEPLGMESWLE